jgi:hypothetical protein
VGWVPTFPGLVLEIIPESSSAFLRSVTGWSCYIILVMDDNVFSLRPRSAEHCGIGHVITMAAFFPKSCLCFDFDGPVREL